MRKEKDKSAMPKHSVKGGVDELYSITEGLDGRVDWRQERLTAQPVVCIRFEAIGS